MLDGVRYFESAFFRDDRGDFVKLFSSNWSGLNSWPVQEAFYTSSKKGVVRGMHLQTGEWENWRLVSVLEGSMFDVLVDRAFNHWPGRVNCQRSSSIKLSNSSFVKLFSVPTQRACTLVKVFRVLE